jgi:hypothetical protein
MSTEQEASPAAAVHCSSNDTEPHDAAQKRKQESVHGAAQRQSAMQWS